MSLAGFSLDSFEVTETGVWMLAVLILSIALHESAHAYVASWRGDPTPALMGRKTLNPFPHLDLIMSVVLPAVMIFSGSGYLFGAGKPVIVRPLAMKVPDRDGALVALAGPAMNALLVLVFTGIYLVAEANGWSPLAHADASREAMFFDVMRQGIRLNLILMIFNLIPVPPLDGSRLVAYLLPSSLKPLWFRLDVVGFVVLIVLFFTGFLDKIFEATYYPLKAWWENVYMGL